MTKKKPTNANPAKDDSSKTKPGKKTEPIPYPIPDDAELAKRMRTVEEQLPYYRQKKD